MKTENQVQTQEQLAEHRAKSLTPRASWNYSLDQIRRDTETYTEEEKQLLVDCFLFCIQENIAFRDFCEKIHYDYTTVGRIYRGAYLNPTTGKPYGIPANMLKGMRDFLETERRRLVLGTTEFVETPTAKRIFTACDLARESGTPVFLWGLRTSARRSRSRSIRARTTTAARRISASAPRVASTAFWKLWRLQSAFRPTTGATPSSPESKRRSKAIC